MKYAILLLFIISNTVLAAQQSGLIEGYIPYSSGNKEVLIFKLNNNVSGGCNVTARFAIDSDSPKYKSTVAAVIVAFHAKSNVKVKYLSSCNALSNAADVNVICVGNINC